MDDVILGFAPALFGLIGTLVAQVSPIRRG